MLPRRESAADPGPSHLQDLPDLGACRSLGTSAIPVPGARSRAGTLIRPACAASAIFSSGIAWISGSRTAPGVLDLPPGGPGYRQGRSLPHRHSQPHALSQVSRPVASARRRSRSTWSAGPGRVARAGPLRVPGSPRRAAPVVQSPSIPAHSVTAEPRADRAPESPACLDHRRPIPLAATKSKWRPESRASAAPVRRSFPRADPVRATATRPRLAPP